MGILFGGVNYGLSTMKPSNKRNQKRNYPSLKLQSHIVPTLCVEMLIATAPALRDAERHLRHSHAERRNDAEWVSSYSEASISKNAVEKQSKAKNLLDR